MDNKLIRMSMLKRDFMGRIVEDPGIANFHREITVYFSDGEQVSGLFHPCIDRSGVAEVLILMAERLLSIDA